MRIDAHQHFRDSQCFGREFLPGDLAPILARNFFDGSIAVQETANHGDLLWLLALADQYPWILGVAGRVDLSTPELPATLDALACNAKFRSIRYTLDVDSHGRLLLSPELLSGLREIERRNIPLDLEVRPGHIPAVLELVELVPSIPVAVDGLSAALASDFHSALVDRLAAVPSVSVKLPGDIGAPHVKTFTKRLWNLFGPGRCMFGSNWPLCLDSGSWKQVLACFTQALGAVPKEFREGVMGINAARFYRLETTCKA